MAKKKERDVEPVSGVIGSQTTAFRAFEAEVQRLITKRAQLDVAAAPVVRIVDMLLALAYAHGASDVHIESYETETLIRFRIDGILHDVATFSKVAHELIVTRVKILSRLRTDEHAAPQDGKFRFSTENGQRVDVRVSIVPVISGEKVVLRILVDTVRAHDLESLGLTREKLLAVRRNMKRPWGMILSTGPTGSGKTTTLYAIVSRLNTRSVNISTIEDPVEYGMERVNQIQVNPKTNLTFATGLRSIVRQDPNIIMVGEIRDEETAGIAVNAALTGHLLLSTLHTNDAATALPRLIDMGVQPFLVASTINVIIAQRLVRKVCAACAFQRPIEPALFAVVREQLPAAKLKQFGITAKRQFTYGQGCTSCQSSGYAGRTMIAEVLEVTDAIRELTVARSSAAVIQEQAVAGGMEAIIDDGLRKAAEGVTTIEEVLRVSQV